MKSINYEFPLVFYYKGWKITITDVTTLLTFTDIKLKASITPHKDMLEHFLKDIILGNPIDQLSYINRPVYLQGTDNSSNIINQLITKNDKIEPIVEAFCNNKPEEVLILKLNGNAIDTLVGKNINMVNKAKHRIITYIDNKMVDIKKEFYNYLKRYKATLA